MMLFNLFAAVTLGLQANLFQRFAGTKTDGLSINSQRARSDDI